MKVHYIIQAFFVLLAFSINGNAQSCVTGYTLGQPLGLVTNGDFSIRGGTIPVVSLTASDDPATDVGTNMPVVGFYSQARREANDQWFDGSASTIPSADKYNVVTLQNGINTFFATTGAISILTFPGEASYNVSSTNNWLYFNGNIFYTPPTSNPTGIESLVWGQSVSGLTIGQTYTFYFYLNNVLDDGSGYQPPAYYRPKIKMKTGGTPGLPDGNTRLNIGEVIANDDNTTALNGWERHSWTFTANATSVNFKLVDEGDYFIGVDLGIASIGLIQCIPIVNASSDISICSGSTGALSASNPSSGTFTYGWTGPNGFSSSGASTSVTNMTAAKQGYYVVTITDSVGVTNQDSVLVSMISSPTVNAGSNQTICSGLSATISGTGANTYSWNQGLGAGTSHSVSPTSTTNYVVTGTDGNGCTDTDAVQVAVNSLPTVNAGSNQSICTGTSATISGSGANTYSWNQGLGAGTSHSVSPTSTTNYVVTGTDGNGCTDTDAVQVAVNSLPTVNAGSNQSICTGTSATISGSGANTYSWNQGLGAGTSHSVSPTSTTNYMVTGTAANGCTDTDVIQVAVNSLPTVNAGSNQSICTGTSATISGSGANTYSWNQGLGAGTSHSVSPTSTTNYVVTGTDGNGCTDTDAVQVAVNSLPTVNAGSNQTICSGLSATISGTGANTYSWNQGLGAGTSHSVSPTSTTNYVVTGTDGNGCTDTDAVQVAVNSLPTVNAGSNQTICSGLSVTISGSGANTYSWNQGLGAGTSHSVSPTSTTNYVVTGTDGNGCTDTDAVQVAVNSLPTVNAGSNQTICSGLSVTISGSGANTYSWNQGLGAGTSHSVSPTSTTNYVVTGTDGNGCTDTDAVQVAVNSLPTVNAGSNQTICSGSSAIISASGAVTYSWNQGIGAGSTHTVNPSSSGWYVVTGVDGNTCVNIDSLNIIVSSSFDASILMPDTTFCLNDSIQGIPIVDNGGVWSGSGISDTINGNFNSVLSGPGTFNIVYSIDNSCGDIDSISITVLDLPQVDITTTINSVCDGDSILLDVTGANSYTWSQGLGINSSFYIMPSNPTTYTVIGVTGQCSNTDSILIDVIDLPSFSVDISDNVICEGEESVLSIVGTHNYTWQGIVTGNSYVFDEVNSSYVNVTGENMGCVISDSVYITVNPLPNIINLTSVSEICEGESTTLTVYGANTYIWLVDNSVGETKTVTPTSSTSYVVQGTSIDGCLSTLEVDVVVDVCEPEIFIPEAFSPNDDGINDFFEIVGLNEYPGNEVFILSRWGDIVFEQERYMNDWDAQNKNNSGKVVQGTYFYIIKLNDKNNNVYKGSVEINYK